MNTLAPSTQYLYNDNNQFTHSIDTYRNLSVVATTQSWRDQSFCTYTYIITCGASSHTAFTTHAKLAKWLELLGLQCDIPALESGESASITGTYRRYSHMKGSNVPSDGYSIPVMTNGEYVQGCIATGKDGIREIHTTNPNAADKKVFGKELYQQVRDGLAEAI